MKACSRCRESYPITAYRKHSTAKSGRHSQCNACLAESQRKRRQQKRLGVVKETTEWNPTESDRMFIAKCRAGNPELVADPTAEKRCGKCSQTLHPTRFTKDVHTKDGLRRICRACASERYKTKELEQ